MASPSSSSSSSVEFQSAVGEEQGMGTRNGSLEGTFENGHVSDEGGEPAQDNHTGSHNGSSRSSQLEIQLANLPKELQAILEQATGILYLERYETFVYNKWPYDVKRGNLCHPKALAMAGLAFHSLNPTPSAQCQVCLTVLHDLQPNSNPWILHEGANPNCYLIKLGQRQNADEYTMDEVLEMMFKKVYAIAEEKVNQDEEALRKQLYKLRQLEIKRAGQSQQETSSDAQD